MLKYKFNNQLINLITKILQEKMDRFKKEIHKKNFLLDKEL